MKSTEKVYAALEELSELEDHEISEALPLPLPPATVRMIIAGAADFVPANAAELDAFLEQVGGFCRAMQSDPEPAEVT